MSHALVIVALSPEDIADAGSIEEAVRHQMEPFCEHDAWFEDGSRWDWYSIGGRWSGHFAPGYEPDKDERNIEACYLCHGTGKRMDALAQEWRLANPAYGCNGCESTGRKVKWPTQWADVGNVITRDELSRLPDCESITSHSFLRDRAWHERARMGFFAMSTATECEVRSQEQTGEAYTGRCIFQHDSGAKIVSYQEDGDTSEQWKRLFWPRFIRNLPPETTLVAVDYHV